MNGFSACLKKDRLEFIRSRKNIICLVVLLGCGAMVLVTTIFLPALLDKVMDAGSFFSDDTSLADFMSKFFPEDLKGSAGILASDIGVFYGLLAVAFTFSLVPDDIKSGRVILPLCAGHSIKSFVISKKLIYSIWMSLPVLAAYMIYYLIGSNFLQNNYDMLAAFVNGLVLLFSIFAIINITIDLSIIFRHKYQTLALMIGIILVAPDALSFFKVGKYFPTYLLTYTYNSSNEFQYIVIPALITIGLIVALDLFAIKFKLKLDVDDRR